MTSTDSNTCSFCNLGNRPGAVFCLNCGLELGLTRTEPAAVLVEPVPVKSGRKAHSEREPRKRRSGRKNEALQRKVELLQKQVAEFNSQDVQTTVVEQSVEPIQLPAVLTTAADLDVPTVIPLPQNDGGEISGPVIPVEPSPIEFPLADQPLKPARHVALPDSTDHELSDRGRTQTVLATASVSDPRTVGAALIVEDQRFELVGDVCLLGRLPNTRDAGGVEGQLVQIPDGNGTVSRTHAMLRNENGVWTLIDLGSMNGTQVTLTGAFWNELEFFEHCELLPGARIRLGDVELEFTN